MNIINRVLRRAAAFAFLLTLAAGFSGNAFATTVYSKTVHWTGPGVTADGNGGYDLNTELCGVVNGADKDGPYLLWVLTASGATNANITGPWGTAPMIQSGNGSFKFISDWYEPASLLITGVSATYYYTGRAPANPQLVISHGCRPFTGTGAWCSPGFWRNALNVPVPNAWTFINVSPNALFNDTVVPDFYADPLATVPTLQTVLQNPQTYSGPGDAPLGLNAYNATGAFLTSQIPGFVFDPSLIGSDTDDDACPLDHSGHLKQPTN
jgi:hypothetical protein